jgi:phosphopantothenate-cysteine ligase
LIVKARDSLNKYKHKLVIGNMLQTRRQKVVFVTKDSSYEVVLKREEILNGMEIEDPIVSNVIASHSEFLKTHQY